MTYEISSTGYWMHDQLTHQEAEQLGQSAQAIHVGPNLHTNDGTWYAITEETAQ
ncbi:hypothetical protein ACFCYI_24725 [Streptomyces sp. NPDC056257]|uniref:hypothetical protein n=1 Tax=Streptomyces sp. NPDC056257 TaxID=3345765 RepID=UPI0035D6E3CC